MLRKMRLQNTVIMCGAAIGLLSTIWAYAGCNQTANFRFYNTSGGCNTYSWCWENSDCWRKVAYRSDNSQPAYVYCVCGSQQQYCSDSGGTPQLDVNTEWYDCDWDFHCDWDEWLGATGPQSPKPSGQLKTTSEGCPAT